MRENIVEQIKEKADIVETIGRIVPLRRIGKSSSGLCPFHKEKTGSFHVYEDSGTYICFGCGAKGDIITFYETYYHLSFMDACDRLADEYGIEKRPGGSFTADKSREALYEVNRFTGSLYYEAIKTPGNPALEYLQRRGIDKATISRFRIGYADNSGRMLSARVENDEKLQKPAEEVGLVYKSGGRYRDKFEGRVMFPIVNTRGKVIGFGGRDISGEAKAKYINSGASSVYTKGAALYGLNLTKGKIHEQGFAIIVEGYMDLVTLFMHGVTNVCAPLGTAFTPQQAKLLGKYTKNVVLAFDSDGAGQKAALASMDVLAREGVRVRVLVLEGAKDPDEFIRAFGRERFDEAVERAVPMYDFKIDRIKAGYDLSKTDEIADFVKEAAKVVAPLVNVDRDVYIGKLSRETGISKEAIAMQAENSLGADADERSAKGRIARASAVPSGDLLGGILGLALESNYAFKKAAEYRHLFSGTDYSGVMDTMIELEGSMGAPPTASELAEALDDADQAALETVLKIAAKGVTGEDDGQIDEYLKKLEIAELMTKEAELKESAGTDELLWKDLMEVQSRIKLLEGEIRNGKRGESVGN